MFLDKFRYFQVESRIIHQNHHIRLPFQDIRLTEIHILEDSTQMQQDRNKAHICQFLVMLDQRSTDFTHQVTAKETEFSLCIPFFQGLHQIGRMQIA